MASCKSFLAMNRLLGFVAALLVAMAGTSVRGDPRVNTFANVGAAFILSLASILSSGMLSQSRSVAEWKYGRTAHPSANGKQFQLRCTGRREPLVHARRSGRNEIPLLPDRSPHPEVSLPAVRHGRNTLRARRT